MTFLEYSTTGLAVKYDGVQLAVFNIPKTGFMRCDRRTFLGESC